MRNTIAPRFIAYNKQPGNKLWLQKMDKNKAEVLELFKKTYGKNDAKSWFQRWRIFFMSCEVLFGFAHGSEWGVSHYLFEKPQ